MKTILLSLSSFFVALMWFTFIPYILLYHDHPGAIGFTGQFIWAVCIALGILSGYRGIIYWKLARQCQNEENSK